MGVAVALNSAAFGVLIGPGFLEHVTGATSNELLTNIQAMRAFVRGCTARPLQPEDYEAALAGTW
jgi:non-heme chloroperoxidase